MAASVGSFTRNIRLFGQKYHEKANQSDTLREILSQKKAQDDSLFKGVAWSELIVEPIVSEMPNPGLLPPITRFFRLSSPSALR